MKRTTLTVPAALAIAVAFLPMSHALAQHAPATQHVLSRGLVSLPHAAPMDAGRMRDHLIFGRLESVRGRLLTLRTRSGHLWNVDATQALTSGDYSAPLFAGKIVEVEASLDRTGVLHATGIMRMGSLDRGTPADR